MKKLVLYIVMSLFGMTAVGVLPATQAVVYAQKKGDDKRNPPERKDPPGPPIVKDKGQKGGNDRPKERPPRDKKPE